MNALEILNQLYSGLITQAEALLQLDKLEIRGALKDKGNGELEFTGYDYHNQKWLVYG